MTKPRAYSYIRMSSDVQLRGDSLRRQTEASRRYAADHDLKLVDDFKLEDIGISAFNGRNVSQGALGRFLAAVEEGLVPQGSYLLVESLDRISREKPQVATSLFLQILGAGVNIVTLMDRHVYRAGSADFTDIIVSVVHMARAHEESLTKSIRVGAAWENKRNHAKTRKLTEMAPAWLALSNDRSGFNVIPERVEIVQRVFDEADSGKGSYQIARQLNLEEVKPFTRSNGWHESYITKILTTRAVLGEFQPHRYIDGKRRPHGDLVQDYFPAIISREQFDRVQLARKARKIRGSGRKGRSHVNLFSGVAKCGYCGASMYVVDKGPKPKGGTYLRCESAKRGNDCKASAWPLAHFETAFLFFVRELDLPALLSNERKQQEFRQLEGRLASLQTELERQKRVREETYSLLATPSVSSEFLGQKINEATVAIGRIEAEIAVLKELLATQRTTGARSDFDVKAVIHGLLSEHGTQFDDRTKVADWIRMNVERLRVYSDGMNGPAEKIAEMESALDPETRMLLANLVENLRRKGSLATDSARRFVVAFDQDTFRSVAVDRNDPTNHMISIHYTNGDWSIDDRQAGFRSSSSVNYPILD
ncbi:recombinase family protein [Sinorhizobium fredii]|uniref:recombinase family protein n=1 Tax=Rhizobium fredii TaxID=380 RepID=UPI001F0A16D4|nr:recombinase family protein [Sinorhizobium fredii]